MKKVLGLWMCFCLMAACTACGSSKQKEQETEKTAFPAAEEAAEAAKEGAAAEAAGETAEEKCRVLVAYFSATGNTRLIAERAADIIGADLFEIVPEEPYSDADLNYNAENCRANKEQADETARPAIKETIADFAQYDAVLIGHPIWWGREPRIIDTFMESYDFSGKTVVNFCTSGGSGISTAADDLQAMTENAVWLEGVRFEASASKEEVQKWIDSLNLPF